MFKRQVEDIQRTFREDVFLPEHGVDHMPQTGATAECPCSQRSSMDEEHSNDERLKLHHRCVLMARDGWEIVPLYPFSSFTIS